MVAGTLMMVEPNPGILIVARNVLSRAGYAVLAAASAREAIAVAKGRRVDAVLLDANEAEASLIASLPEPHRIPVILTFQRGQPPEDHADIDETQRGVAAADVLEKPFAPDRLVSTVERVLATWRVTPRPRSDTLVSDPAPGGDELFDADKTDIFPFARLLERPDTPVRSEGAPVDARSARVAEHLRTFLEREGVTVSPEVLTACLRACNAALEVGDERLTSLPGQAAPTPAIEGVIPELSIDQVLQLAMAVGQPSRCRVVQGSTTIEVYYEDRQIVFARHGGLPDGFLLGRMLVAAGRVQEKALRAALSQPGEGGRIGERLLARGDVSQADVAGALRTQTEELVYELVRWSSGRFEIFAAESLPREATWARQRIPVPHLLLEGMRRLDEWRLMRPTVGDLESILDRTSAATIQDIKSLSAEDRAVFRHVDGRRTVGEVVNRVARPTLQVYRSLHALAGRRLIALQR